jgi:hypothetical protein
MAIDWSAVAEARKQAHWAAQWPSRAARANLPAVQDDSHSSLAWDEKHYVVTCQPLAGGLRVGLDISGLRLVSTADKEVFPLAGAADSDAGAWVDALLVRNGLKRATAAKVPYEIERVSYTNVDSAALAQLSRWFSAASAALEALRAKNAALRPGPSPVRLWPHHFDIATLVALEEGDDEYTRSIGVGLSPGDGYYAQPYAYVSPWPKLDPAKLPPPPAGGHWHTKDFVALVASADELAGLGDPDEALARFMDHAFEVVHGSLHA